MRTLAMESRKLGSWYTLSSSRSDSIRYICLQRWISSTYIKSTSWGHTTLHGYTRTRENNRMELGSVFYSQYVYSLNNQSDIMAFMYYINKTHRSKKSVSSYRNGEFFVRWVHCPDNRTKLLHEELKLVLMSLNIFSHQDGNLQDDQTSCQTKKIYI